jgi:hypothetical protein
MEVKRRTALRFVHYERYFRHKLMLLKCGSSVNYLDFSREFLTNVVQDLRDRLWSIYAPATPKLHLKVQLTQNSAHFQPFLCHWIVWVLAQRSKWASKKNPTVDLCVTSQKLIKTFPTLVKQFHQFTSVISSKQNVLRSNQCRDYLAFQITALQMFLFPFI